MRTCNLEEDLNKLTTYNLETQMTKHEKIVLLKKKRSSYLERKSISFVMLRDKLMQCKKERQI